ncbi:hypothetical protein [Paenibacillus sp. FSL R10-2734]|uniref:hypothetical protein n=1 Tax=Paenibacillus sp. FSL R10-2734 TaxID=2954691 RepID=UPI0030D83C23
MITSVASRILISYYTTPLLTTIRQNKDKISRLAALMLHDLINKQSGTRLFSVDQSSS